MNKTEFYADFHIHSRYSRATSPDLNLEEMYKWGVIKGIKVLGTGDFTHPEWFAEIKSKLIETEEGIYSLKGSEFDTRFMLTTELSFIYKKDDKVRKIHMLYFAPDIKTVELINSSLDCRFNLKSDGRPILGADVRDISAELLDINENILVIPAHIWTPWFSLLGSKSGFDSVEQCFAGLSKHIFAVETGLSADPVMLSQVPFLKGMTNISNSDCHSAKKIGREANQFDCGLSYPGIYQSIRNNSLKRTIEFFPHEGKYYFDGHRKCGVSMSPDESAACNNICPVCGKELTLGVCKRVRALGQSGLSKKQGFIYQIPLTQILSRLFKVGENSKRVSDYYFKLIKRFDNEFNLLLNMTIEEIARENEGLAAAIAAVRAEDIELIPGFDGEYGQINFKLPLER